jgi:hypothetical protein
MSSASTGPGGGESAAVRQVESDAHFSIIPTLPKERVWGMADFTVVNAALAIATWCFITGGYIAYVLPAKAGVAVVFFALLFGFGLVLVGSPLPAAKYGIDLCQHARSSMGVHGAGAVGLFVILVMVYLNNAIIYPMLGKGITNIIAAYTPLSDRVDYWLAAVFGILALLLTWWVVVKGPVYIKWFNWVVAPGLVIVMIILLVFIFKDYGWSEISSAPPTGPSGDTLWDYTIAIEWSLGFAFSWWWIMGAMARITKTQRAVAVGFVVGEAFPAGIAIIIGMFTALVVGTFDPTEWLIPVAGRGWGVCGRHGREDLQGWPQVELAGHHIPCAAAGDHHHALPGLHLHTPGPGAGDLGHPAGTAHGHRLRRLLPAAQAASRSRRRVRQLQEQQILLLEGRESGLRCDAGGELWLLLLDARSHLSALEWSIQVHNSRHPDVHSRRHHLLRVDQVARHSPRLG